MNIISVGLKNVKSFSFEQVLKFDGDISIIIGPNGSGKTNLLDAIFITLRRNIFLSWVTQNPQNAPGRHVRFQLQRNDQLSNIQLPRHVEHPTEDQVIVLELGVTQQDVDNILKIASQREGIENLIAERYSGVSMPDINRWLEHVPAVGQAIKYSIVNGNVQPASNYSESVYLEYLANFDWLFRLLAEVNSEMLPMPMLLFSTLRTSGGFATDVSLVHFSEGDMKKQVDASHSKMGGAYTHLAVGRISQRYRVLLERVGADAMGAILDTPELKKLNAMLAKIGYAWRLECTNPHQNQYSIMISKDGREFSVADASSGEKELLTYLFTIYGLNVRDAIIFIDEPELHLHPRWQKILMDLFGLLARETGNKFLLATHSPTFVSPETISLVSRVVMEDGASKIIRLRDSTLPNSRHLFSIVNSHNNESIFFADKVVLVEGISDRLFFRKILPRFLPESKRTLAIEIIAVGGKGYFSSYKKILEACAVPHCIVADRDYIEQIGGAAIKGMFKLNSKEIKVDVVDNVKSLDGQILVDRIDAAMSSGDWGEAGEIWSYIKSRRIMLKSELTDGERNVLNEFVEAKRLEGVYVLKMGALESYLPSGFMSKDIEKLIEFLDDPDFWEKLPDSSRQELTEICNSILS
ncbi:AAA family ATPase [Burkholderia cepacia]|uniref:AAA family ATPase n=1 Tax=Burkholderia cepacia TaxID=292 RepID=UPI0026513167|nr:AAA family ATPase [Burkholderia cepacia]MDN7637133.1 AAA family ATPase [Burkholderia cepacia]